MTHLQAVPITQGPKHHFFGYYDKLQWDVSGRYVLGYEVDFIHRPPTPDDILTIGYVDITTGEYVAVAETKAWCWQQGAMLQWLPGSDSKIIYNDRIGDRFVSVIHNISDNKKQVLPRPIYTVSGDGNYGLSLNFARLGKLRPGYGYYGLPDVWEEEAYSEEDGIYLMDLTTGEHKLIVSLNSMVEHSAEGLTSHHWTNHLLFNPQGDRFIFLHRWANDKGRYTRLCTADTSGNDIFVSSLEKGSHFIWLNNTQILIWGYTEESGPAYYIIDDKTDQMQTMGVGLLTRNGHCTVSPCGNWILTDEYPAEDQKRPLILYKPADNLRMDIGRFYSPPELVGEIRCDLHPRWSRDGKSICIDSAHTGERQMYMLDVSEII